jgi:integrase
LTATSGTLPVACALRLAPLVFVRPGELRKAVWADIDLDAAEWCYHATEKLTASISCRWRRQAVATYCGNFMR